MRGLCTCVCVVCMCVWFKHASVRQCTRSGVVKVHVYMSKREARIRQNPQKSVHINPLAIMLWPQYALVLTCTLLAAWPQRPKTSKLVSASGSFKGSNENGTPFPRTLGVTCVQQTASFDTPWEE